MEKSEVRQVVLGQLEHLRKNPQLKFQKEQAIQTKLFASQWWQEAKSIGITLAIELEFNTDPIIKQAWQEGKTVLVPKTLPKGQMIFIPFTPDTQLEISDFGVKEPQINDIIEEISIDLLVVPGVAFRQDGYRVGFGGGFYDRYLAHFTGRSCSLVFSEQKMEDWQISQFDRPVQRIFEDENQGKI